MMEFLYLNKSRPGNFKMDDPVSLLQAFGFKWHDGRLDSSKNKFRSFSGEHHLACQP